jgi:Glycosyl hydrolase family 62
MNSKLYGRINNHAFTACAVLLAASMNVYSWSVNGTVKNQSTGAALSGVAVTVKDSTKYTATTDASGNFKLESAVGVVKSHSVVTGAYSLSVNKSELLITVPQNGKLELTMFNCSGRTIWSSKVTTTDKAAKLQLPSTLSHTAAYLQVKQEKNAAIHSLAWTSDGLHIGPSSGSLQSVKQITAAAMANPTLEFKKTDFRDTSITMTSETMTDMSVSMTPSVTCDLPSNPSWTSSGILVSPKGGSYVSVKDPTIQKYNGKYLIYATVFNTADKAGGNEGTFQMEYIEFTDFSKADQATPYYMTSTSGFSGYKCAPELFYFEPQDLWYLIWQQQEPAYSTTKTPDKPGSWSTPKSFVSNWESSWKPLTKPEFEWGTIDYWPIADDKNFYLFMTGDDGAVYRSKTTLANFPNGFSTPVIAKSFKGDKSIIFEGSSHYKIKGTTNTYLHVVEGMGGTGRVFSSWTSEGIEGTWKDHRVGTSTPFAGKNNVSYPSGSWTNDVSHGELLRDNPNQQQILDPCNLQFLFQGLDPSKESVSYNLKPYRLGLLTLKK